jgi:CRISPR-associated protein Csx10
MTIIRLKIETLQPVLATSFAGDPNSDVSYSYLPGSILRGALIGRYLRIKQQQELNLADPVVKNLFFDDRQSSYLNAYPVSQSGCRTLPIPRSWIKEKGQEPPLKAYDFSMGINEDLESPKPLDKKSFWSYAKGDDTKRINLYQPSKRINIHNARDRSKGRGTDGEGQIFRYEAIDTGETFEGIIICPANYVSEVEKLLKSQDFWLGGSQSAGYGHVHVTYEISNKPWQESLTQPDAKNNELHITLLSDMILRDEMGQVTASPDLLIKAISAKTGVELDFHRDRRSYLGQTTIGGFNRKWGLPLPQTSALAMGSVLVLTRKLTPEMIKQLESEGIGEFRMDELGKLAINSEIIRQIESEGIGERRIDGFGRLAINSWQQESFDIVKLDEPFPDLSKITLVGSELDIISTIAQRILHQRLEILLQKRASELSIRGNISNSQLSRLRFTARESISTDDSLALILLLGSLPKNALEQFNHAQVDGQSLMSWIKTNIEKELGQWIVNPDQLKVSINNQDYEINDSMKREYTLRLIMALAKKASKMEVSK